MNQTIDIFYRMSKVPFDYLQRFCFKMRLVIKNFSQVYAFYLQKKMCCSYREQPKKGILVIKMKFRKKELASRRMTNLTGTPESTTVML